MKLVVTIPALNEEKTIGDVVSDIPREIEGVDEVRVVVVDDGSTDRTAELAEAAGAEVVSMGKRVGLGKVFRVGLERAMEMRGDVIVNIDGDGQFDAGDIPKLIRPILDDEADFVTCTRFGDKDLAPVMPRVKRLGNGAVTWIINRICGNTNFTDVSCGFRAFSAKAAYRLTLFGKFTYTQETFIDLHSKGLRIAEVPLKVRGVREHGKSRIARSIMRYAVNSGLIILKSMRDLHPMRFFGGISVLLGLFGLAGGGFLLGWFLYYGKTTPFTSLVTVSGVLVVLSFVMMVFALLADMMGRHRRISEEVLYLARMRSYRSIRQKREIARSLIKTVELREIEAKLDIHVEGDAALDKARRVRDKAKVVVGDDDGGA